MRGRPKSKKPEPVKPEGVYEAVNRKRDNIVGNLSLVPIAEEYAKAVDLMEDYLRAQKKRCTIERRFVLQLLYQSTQPIDIRTLHELVCKECGNVSLTTVYSTIDLLVQLHLARRFELVSHGMAFVERTLGTEPHGYVVCNECATISVLSLPTLLEDLQPQMPRGFKSDDYSLIVHGLCSKCQRKLKTKTRKKQPKKTTLGGTAAQPIEE